MQNVSFLTEICLKYHILDLYVFGSRAEEIASFVENRAVFSSGSQSPDSDVDIGILPEQMSTWGPEKKVQLAAELEDLFRADRVDLVLLPEADPFLAVDIIRGQLLYTNDPDRQARYELFVLRRAGDLLPFKKERTRMVLEEGARWHRNRMVHFYHEISSMELYQLCTQNLKDIEDVLELLVDWLRNHPDKLDRQI